MTQYHFLDDSGDPGLSGAVTSSSHLAVAIVQLTDTASLRELADVRRTFHFPPTFEFKYHKTKHRHRVAFFEAIKPIPFRARAVVVDKSNLPQEFIGLKGQALTVEFIARLVLRASPLDIANDILIVDGNTPKFIRQLRIRLSQECRKTDRVHPFNKIISRDSGREDGLQVADMIAGAVRQYVMGVEREYYQAFASKVVDLWRIPERGK
ncbi:MAG: DUF3800 domain-containing protein [Chloroflexi bacterium]|nr:DUF3800 domain-containing protein [Chloroflexota bacterium]